MYIHCIYYLFKGWYNMDNNQPKKDKEELIQMTIALKPTAKGRIKTWGNSLAIRIPSDVAKEAGLSDGSDISFHVSEEGNIVLRPSYPAADDQEGLRELFLSLRGSSKPGVRAHEEQFGDAMGDEIV